VTRASVFADCPHVLELARSAGRGVAALDLNPWEPPARRTPRTRAWLRWFSTSEELRTWQPIVESADVWSDEHGRRVSAELERRLAPFVESGLESGMESGDSSSSLLAARWRRANGLAPAGFLVGVHPRAGHFGLWRVPRDERGRPVGAGLLAAIWDGRVAFSNFCVPTGVAHHPTGVAHHAHFSNKEVPHTH